VRNISVPFVSYFVCDSRGYAEAEIEAVFAKYDLDGDRVLDEGEQRKMHQDLEGQKVSLKLYFHWSFVLGGDCRLCLSRNH
jgi:hypothetical protein